VFDRLARARQRREAVRGTQGRFGDDAAWRPAFEVVDVEVAGERQLQAQDAQLAAEIAEEQNRWQDFNTRLDDLEKSLSR